MFGFNDDDDEQAFGGMMRPNPMQMMGGGAAPDDGRMMAAMAVASMAGMFNPEGQSPALRAIQMMGQYRQGQQRNALAQGKLKLQMDEAARLAKIREQAGSEIAQLNGAAPQVTDPQFANMETVSPGFDNQPAAAAPNAMGAGPGPEATPFNKRQAAFYRRMALRMTAEGAGEDAKRYADIANSLDPVVQEEWSNPVAEVVNGKPAMVQYSKQGGRRLTDGTPLPRFTAPTASANGMITMDQNSGQVQNLGVGVHEADPAIIKEYEMAQQQGFKGSMLDYQKAKAAAGATRIHTTLSPVIRTANSMGEQVGKDVAVQAVKDVQGGHAATQALNNVQSVRANLPEAITGPLAEARTFLTRAANAVGIGDYSKKLEATQRTVQGLARMSLDGAAMMEGQGQITQPERILIDKAASAPQSLSREEIAASLDIVERVQGYKVQQADSQGQAILANPDLAPVHPHVRSQLEQQHRAQHQKPKGREASGPVTNSIPTAAIAHLRKNPALAAQFDAKYGPGAAARVLGGN